MSDIQSVCVERRLLPEELSPLLQPQFLFIFVLLVQISMDSVLLQSSGANTFPHFRIKVDHLWDLQRKQLFKFRKLQPHRMNPDKPSEMTIQRQKQSKCDTGA